MRVLTEEETKVFFTKLAEFIGGNIKYLIERSDEPYVFRMIKDRVWYMSEKVMKLANIVGRDELVSAGVCFGKFTKGGKFRLQVTSLNYVGKYAVHKIWLKPQGEQSYLYGNHVVRAHVGRMTDTIPKYSGVVLYSMNDMPIGFGVLSRAQTEFKDLEPTAIVIFNQADLGEYLRVEDEDAQQN